MIIIDNIDQGTEEWFQEKLGIPSASNFNKILSATGKPSTQAKGYLYQLAAERITGERAESYKNEIMEEGNIREAESRSMYELTYSVEVEEVGVIYPDENKRFLCSPDGLINREYGLEMKNVLPKTQVKYLINNKVPNEYYVQVQGSMLVTGYDRWDFFSYSPGLPLMIIEERRDNNFCNLLKDKLEKFCDELEEVVEKIKERKINE